MKSKHEAVYACANCGKKPIATLQALKTHYRRACKANGHKNHRKRTQIDDQTELNKYF